MYCINCGAHLADSEKSCPLCGTGVYHPDMPQKNVPPLYPPNRIPKPVTNKKVLPVAVTILFLISAVIPLLADVQFDGSLDWFGYVAGALFLAYVLLGLPLWFKKPYPVVFTPVGFVTAGLYLLYINLVTKGDWFLSFAFPVLGGFGLITCTVVTLLCCLKKGRLYTLGGAFIALGGLCLLMEFLLDITFGFPFIGWSVYPLIVLVLLGSFLLYLAVNHTARETMERKLFF